MAHFIVSVNAVRDTTQCVPEPLKVDQGDTIQWGSFHGAVKIQFEPDNTPVDRPTWSADRQQLTGTARVVAISADSHCVVTITMDDGRVVEGHSQVVVPSTDR